MTKQAINYQSITSPEDRGVVLIATLEQKAQLLTLK